MLRAACGLLILAALCGVGRASTVKQGSISFTPCPDSPAVCADVPRPLDPSGRVLGTLKIHVEYFRHKAAGPAQGTLVAADGGPGYPSTLSRDDYLYLFKPLMDTRDVLLMDNRGTGRSSSIDCHELQISERYTVEQNAACGRALGASAPFYGSGSAADDLAAILQALSAPPVDLYGNSYGTYFAQVFAVRHPNLVRSVILDGAYPLDGADYAWYPTYAPAMREKFNVACARSPACAALPGDSMGRIQSVLAQLRAHPMREHSTDYDGKVREFLADPSTLATVMFSNAPPLVTVRELDAAARSFVGGDRAPLLRLMAESLSSVDSRDPAANPKIFSAGLAIAVMCQDAPQIFDMRLAPPERRLDRDRALRERQQHFPDTYAPFSIDEYRGLPLDYGFIDQCVDWPVTLGNREISQVVPSGTAYPDVPVLVLSGDLDNMTTLADGAAAAAHFKRGHQIVIRNGFHVNALPRSRGNCAADLARRFIERLDVGNDDCKTDIPPVRLLDRFAQSFTEVDPAQENGSNHAEARDLRLAAAVVQTLGDVAIRAKLNESGHGVGLRGGRFEVHAARDGVHVQLHELRYTSDLALSGSFDVTAKDASALANVVLVSTDGTHGALRVSWQDTPAARVHLSGHIGQHGIEATTTLP